MQETKIWGIHNTHKETMLLDEKVIALGWSAMGNLLSINQEREAYKEKYKNVYPNATRNQIANSAGQLYRFVNEANIGDYIIYPTKFNRQINIGKIESNYFFDSNENEYNQKRKVKWLKSVPRTVFSQGALYEVGSAMSFFSIKNYYDEYMKIIEGNYKKNEIPENDESISVTTEATIESTKDYILKELSKNYKGYELEKVVADLLNAMGYKTKMMPQGGDRGKDIIAYKDELPPRILVQVKSSDSDIKETQVQSLRGAMNEGDYGLFVTLSDYTKNAKDYLEKMTIIKSINGSEFVDLILKYYDLMSDDFKNIIQLKKVYIPIIKSEE